MKSKIKKFFNFLLTKKIKNRVPLIVLLFVPFIFLIWKDLENFIVTLLMFLFLLRMYFNVYSETKPGQAIAKLVLQNLKKRKLIVISYLVIFTIIFLLPTDRNIFVLILSITLTIVNILLIDKMRFLSKSGNIEYKNKSKVIETVILFMPTTIPLILTIYFLAGINILSNLAGVTIFT